MGKTGSKGILGRATEELRDGRISDAEYSLRIEPNLKGVARRVMRILRCPSWYSEEDLLQELRLSAWRKAWSFDASRSVGAGRYVLWGLFADAKKCAHVARHGRRRRDETTREVPREDGGGAWLYGREPEGENAHVPAFTEPSQGQRSEHMQSLWQACRSDADWIVVSAILLEGALVPAARALMQDEDARRTLSLRSDAEAEEAVLRAARRVVQRLEQSPGP